MTGALIILAAWTGFAVFVLVVFAIASLLGQVMDRLDSVLADDEDDGFEDRHWIRP